MNRKKIIAIIILIIGTALIAYGTINFIKLENNKKNSAIENNSTNEDNPSDEDNNNETSDDEDLDDYNSLENGLIFSKFTVAKGEDDEESLVTFSLLNNQEESFKANTISINVYKNNNDLLDTYNYEIDEIEANEEIGIEVTFDCKYEDSYLYEVVLGDTKTMVKANTEDIYKIN